ncbi:MAG TPA: hypothetical protein VGM50_16895 [Gemmatimonadaceae bacterium]|jgi:hypothetical protein
MKKFLFATAIAGTMAFSTPAALEPHPHIRSALQELIASRQELQTAAHDFGGHRASAIKAVDAAIAQLRIAIKYDK